MRAAGRTVAVLRAAPEPLAINHHRTRQRQAADIGARHAGQKLGGAGIVGRGVVRHIADRRRQARLWRPDARPRRRRAAPHRSPRHRARRLPSARRPRSILPRLRRCTSGRRESSTRTAWPRAIKRAQNMAADETGAAGEQNAHDQAPSRRRRCSGRAGWPRSDDRQPQESRRDLPGGAAARRSDCPRLSRRRRGGNGDRPPLRECAGAPPRPASAFPDSSHRSARACRARASRSTRMARNGDMSVKRTP